MDSGIYIIRNTINKKVYIGSAVSIKQRFINHRSDLFKNKHCNIHLQRFVNKYGFDTLSFEILERVLNKKNLIKREQFYIDSYVFSNLFNLCRIAGSSLGLNHSESAKKKMSESSKGRNIGRKLSEATKKKIGESAKGNINMLGKKHSEDTKKKMSESQKKKTVLIFKDGVLIDTILGTTNVANKYNLNQSDVSRVCLGKRKTTGGYTMKYK